MPSAASMASHLEVAVAQSLRTTPLLCTGGDPMRKSSPEAWHGCSGVETQLLLGNTAAAAAGVTGPCWATPPRTGGF